MQIILYRHAEPTVSINEKIRGCDFSKWVQRYNESGIKTIKNIQDKEKVIYTSDLLRSIETGQMIGENIIASPLSREAGIPLIKFPAINIKAQYWLIMARILWLLGVKTGCESFSDAKVRAKEAVDWFENILSKEERIVVVGHGFMNRLIKKELLNRGWLLKQTNATHSYLGKMIFENQTNL